MNEQTKERVNSAAKFAFPTLGLCGLLGMIVAGGGLSVVSLIGMLMLYEPLFFGITFTAGFMVAAVGTFEMSRRLFMMGEQGKNG